MGYRDIIMIPSPETDVFRKFSPVKLKTVVRSGTDQGTEKTLKETTSKYFVLGDCDRGGTRK